MSKVPKSSASIAWSVVTHDHNHKLHHCSDSTTVTEMTGEISQHLMVSENGYFSQVYLFFFFPHKDNDGTVKNWLFFLKHVQLNFLREKPLRKYRWTFAFLNCLIFILLQSFSELKEPQPWLQKHLPYLTKHDPPSLMAGRDTSWGKTLISLAVGHRRHLVSANRSGVYLGRDPRERC